MIIKIILILALIITPSISYADFNSEVDSFLDNVGLGDNSNVTSATSWKGKASNYYSLGGFYTKSNVKNIQPVAVRLPELRSGCGGIDFYAGGFSFINEDQFVAMGKGIVSNAKGFVFKAALGLVSPAFEGWMDDLQKMAQKVNNFNLNSCDMAKGAIGSLASLSETTSRAFCKTKGNSSGLFTDYAAAQAGCDNNNQAASQSYSKEDKNSGALPRNLVWNILTKNEGDSLTTADIEYYELLMTLTGTVMMNNTDPKFQYEAGIGAKDETINILMNGGTLEILKCDEALNCMNPSKQNQIISVDNSFKGRVQNMINQIRQKVTAETLGSQEKFTDIEKNFINKSPYGIPILKIIEVQQAYKKFDSVFSLDGLEDFLALNLIYNFISELISNVEEEAYFNQAAGEAELNQLLHSLQNIREKIYQQQQKNNSQLDSINNQIATVQRIENYINSQNLYGGFGGRN